MKISEVIETIPIALQELRDAGYEPVPIDELGEQVTLHDKVYMARRDSVRRILGHLGIGIPELPYGGLRPRPGIMRPALRQLEQDGVISSEIEQGFMGDIYGRKIYKLIRDNSEA
jgi:hypothetical protein